MGRKDELKRLICQELGISIRHFNHLLRGSRNASPKLARRLEKVTDIHKMIWVFGDGEARKKLFKNLLKRQGFM